MWNIEALTEAMAPLKDPNYDETERIKRSIHAVAKVWRSQECQTYIEGLGKILWMIPKQIAIQELLIRQYTDLWAAGRCLDLADTVLPIRYDSNKALKHLRQISYSVTFIKENEPVINDAFRR